MRAFDRVLALAALAAASLAGCSPDADVLARAGDRTITVAEFESVARGNEFRYPGPPDSAKALLFDDLTRRMLLLAEAKQRGLYDDTLTRNFRRATEERVLLQELYDRMAAPPQVSDAEVAVFAGWRDSIAHMQLVYTPQRAGIDAALDQIRRGAPFEQVADRYNLPGLLPPGGDLGPVVPGSLVAPLDGLLRTARVGEVIGPLQAPGEGWFLVRVLERRANPRREGPEQAPMLREMLRQRKTRLVRMNATLEMRAAWNLRLAEDGPQTLFHRFNPGFDPATGRPLPPPPPSPDEAKVVLATYDGGVYSLADAYADLERPEERPNTTLLPSIQAWLESQVTRRIAVAEARRRMIDREPEVRAQIDRAVDNYVLDAIYRSDVLADAQPDEAYLRGHFASRPGAYDRLESVELEIATLADTAEASRVLRHGAEGASLAEALVAAGSAAAAETRVVDFPGGDPSLQLLQGTIQASAPGQWLPPQRTVDGTRVMRIVSKRQTPQSFETLTADAMLRLRSEAQERRADETFRRVTDHLRNLLKPETFPERLRRIPWPVPAPPGADPAA